jgi:hypothetical protein
MAAHDARGHVEIAAHPGIIQGLIQAAVFLVPYCGSAMQDTAGRRLGSIELSLEHLLKQSVISIPLLVIIQGHDKQIHSVKFSKNGIGSPPVEEHVAKLPAKPIGHRGFYEELAEFLGLAE